MSARRIFTLFCAACLLVGCASGMRGASTIPAERHALLFGQPCTVDCGGGDGGTLIPNRRRTFPARTRAMLRMGIRRYRRRSGGQLCRPAAWPHELPLSFKSMQHGHLHRSHRRTNRNGKWLAVWIWHRHETLPRLQRRRFQLRRRGNWNEQNSTCTFSNRMPCGGSRNTSGHRKCRIPSASEGTIIGLHDGVPDGGARRPAPLVA